MGTQQAFKTYERGQRIQNTSISFKNGMSFTDAPLSEGFSRLLVNYDFGTEDTTLVPRNGLLTTGEGLCGYEGLGLDLSEDMSILAGNKVVHNSIEYKQVIVGKISSSITYDIYVGDAWVITCKGNTLKYYPLNDTTTKLYGCYFTKPKLTEASIHGIPLQESPYIKTHVGTFAFNDEYYYFTSDGKLRHTYFNEAHERFETAVVTAYTPLQGETQNSLYNMLLKNPYSFECTISGSSLQLTGFQVIKKDTDTPVLYPKLAMSYDYKLYYTHPGNDTTGYYMHMEYTNGTERVSHIVEGVDEHQLYIPSSVPFLFKNINFAQNKYVSIDIYAVKASDAAWDSNNRLTLDALTKARRLPTTILFNDESSTNGTTNLEPINYDLSYARGMTYWKNRLFVFGAKDNSTNKIDNTVLFASDVNRPDWFPYTANADIFDEEIIYIQPMLDDLLVFTAQNLYSLTLSTDGLSWTKKHLQSNLNIKPWDLNLIQIVKNMVFFKSGNYYYMVVPKLTSASGQGLAIAPVTKSIESFLDNFLPNVKQIIDDVYNYSLYTRYRERAKTTFDIKLLHYYNHLDYEDIHNTYLFEVVKHTKVGYNSETNEYIYEDSEPILLNFSLLYNTVSRTWRVYMSESERMVHPLFMNSTGCGTYASIVEHNSKACLQFLEYSNTIFYDAYIKQNEDSRTRANIFKNWQYFDSGNMEQNSDMKKRFREYQFKINNSSKAALEFYSGFFIDKLTRTYEMQYNEEEIKDDDSDSDISTVIIDAIPKHTSDDSSNEISWTTLGKWKLGTSQFPNVNIWKIRIPTSGKGYLPRTVLISYNEHDFELLSHSTVYRQLYSR